MKAVLRFIFCACLSLQLAGGAHAQDVAAADARAIRKVIEAQLDAFARDDAERAFSFATPVIRQLFGTPERFIAMVRRGYPVVYRPARVTFLRPEPADGEITQDVQMQDAEGATWIARYRMQRQRDDAWRIGGVEVAPAKSRAI